MQSPISNLVVSRENISFLHNLLIKKTQARITGLAACLTLFFLGGALATATSAQTADSLNLNIVGSTVLTTVVEPDGQILIGGEFTSVLGVPRNNIARINADGTLDTGFDPNASGAVANGAVLSIAVQANGQVLAGGYFTNIGGQPRNRIARLDAATGLADAAFNPNANSPLPADDSNTVVMAIRVDASGNVLAGGVFTNIGGQPRNNVARLSSTNGLADAFNPNADSDVLAIAVQANGEILIGGNFENIGGATRNKIARFNVNGTLDTGFNPNVFGIVQAIAVQGGGQIVFGGNFTTVGGVTRNSIARVSSTGTLDAAFNPDADGDVLTIALQTDGKILVGGAFTTIGGQTRNRIARLISTTGAADTFNPNAGSVVRTIALQADGKVLAGGDFANIGSQSRNLFARLFTDTAPTAATASVSGRVTVAAGRGLGRARVTISDSNGMIRSTVTNPQGFYHFDDIPTGSTFVFEVISKKYRFAPQVVSINENISNLNFTTR